MCIKQPKVKKPPIMPDAPPVPEEAPRAVVKNETASTNTAKKKGKSNLRIDLNPAVSSGLRL